MGYGVCDCDPDYASFITDNKDLLAVASIRTFIAVDISDRIRSAAGRLVSGLAGQCEDYTWVDNSQLHITLNFLGEVPDTMVPEICRVTSGAIDGVESFSMHVQGLGCFPATSKPRVVWLGIEEGAEKLIQLNDQIAEALEGLRIPRERKDFVPHLTLGRLKRGGRWNQQLQDSIAQNEAFDGGSCFVEEVVVYSSFLDRSGPSYTAMSRIELA
jgi:2'-5' RNA ligase